ncbi:hypothetical protein QNN88_10075 [Citrobacter sp. ANG330]|uniref:hypothetical protein n=1 Tax=Citrobacter sp. ANG330 TaxID=3048142 RepID=UPI0039C47D87
MPLKFNTRASFFSRRTADSNTQNDKRMSKHAETINKNVKLHKKELSELMKRDKHLFLQEECFAINLYGNRPHPKGEVALSSIREMAKEKIKFFNVTPNNKYKFNHHKEIKFLEHEQSKNITSLSFSKIDALNNIKKRIDDAASQVEEAREKDDKIVAAINTLAKEVSDQENIATKPYTLLVEEFVNNLAGATCSEA